MILYVVIPSYNRANLLPRTLESLHNARRPEDLSIHVYLVDNNSKDHTAQVVREYQRSFAHELHYILETHQGRSSALNAGISAGAGDLVAMIDDDEEVADSWFEVIAAKFREPDLDFIGGPYYPRWGAPKPEWITKESGAIVGWVDGGPEERTYGPEFNAMLMGGNAVVRRSVFERVGLYSPQLGRTALAGGVQALKGMVGLEEPKIAFAGELQLWNLGGFIKGRFFERR